LFIKSPTVGGIESYRLESINKINRS